MSLAKIAVVWCGGLLVLVGVLYVVATDRMLSYAELTGLSATGLTDVRVMYAAFQIAPGLFMLASLWRERWLEPAVALATLLFVFVPAIRIYGMALDGSANTYHLAAVSIELATCALAWVAWRSLRRAHGGVELPPGIAHEHR